MLERKGRVGPIRLLQVEGSAKEEGSKAFFGCSSAMNVSPHTMEAGSLFPRGDPKFWNIRSGRVWRSFRQTLLL